MSSPSEVPVKVSFSFYPQDVTVLAKQTVELRKLGAMVRRGTVLRALIEITNETEMFAATVLLHRDYVAKGGARETDNVAGIPTVDLPKRLVTKVGPGGHGTRRPGCHGQSGLRCAGHLEGGAETGCLGGGGE